MSPLTIAKTTAIRHLARQGAPAALVNSARRRYHGTPAAGFPYKDDQNRESLKPRSQEYSRSEGGDNEAAHTETAFNPGETRPEEEKKKGGGPLEASPAKKELSKAKPQKEDKTSGQQKQSPSSGGGRK